MQYDRLDPLDMDHDALRESRVTVIGAGATGSHMIAQLARLGVDIHIIDRDVLQEENLATSALYTTEMVEDRLPKTEAAREAVERINPAVAVETTTADITAATLPHHLAGPDLVLDGTDNIETRHAINEHAAREDLPWVHVAAIRRSGTAMPVTPDGPCFNCLFADTDPAALPSCATAGIDPSAAMTAAALGVRYGTTLLGGDAPRELTRFTLPDRFRTVQVTWRQDCAVCNGDIPRRDDGSRSRVTALCGEDAYQIRPDLETDINMDKIGDLLPDRGKVYRNEHLLRYEGDVVFTLFPDGRAIIAAETPERARTIYAQYIGM